MNRTIASFYRLTEKEKEALIEACRQEIERKKVQDTETVRRILDELLAEKWKSREASAKEKLYDLQQKAAEAEELKKKLTVAEARNSELHGDLALSGGKVSDCQERLKKSEERVIRLAEMLTDTENQVRELQARLKESEKTADDLRKVQASTALQSNDLREKLTESEEEAEELRIRQLAAEQQIAHLQQQLKESGTRTALPRRRKTKYPLKKKIALGLTGCLAGLILAAAIGVYAVPVRYYKGVTDETWTLWYTGEQYTLSFGINLFGNVAGCTSVTNGSELQFVNFMYNGRSVGIWDYRFPDGGVYCGLGDFDEPRGLGIYTYADGKRSFGIWNFTEDMAYDMNGETCRYVGMLRGGQLHGYGVLEDSEGNRCFAGEFRDGTAVRGKVFHEDGTTSDFKNQ